MGNRRDAVALGHDLALLGHAQVAGDGGWRQRQHRLGRRAAPASQGAAPPVEESHVQLELARQPGQALLRVVELPIGSNVAAVLYAVGIADHADLVAAQQVEMRLVGRLTEHVAKDVVGAAQVVDRFQQGHDRQRHMRHVLAGRPQAAEPEHSQHVAGMMRHAHDQGAQRTGPVAGSRSGQQAEQVERFPRGRAEPFRREAADGLARRIGQEKGLLAVLSQAAKIDAQPQLRGQFLYREAQPAGLLANVQLGGVETQHGDAVEPLLDQPFGQCLVPALPQNVGD